jgi:hypothetical protein
VKTVSVGAACAAGRDKTVTKTIAKAPCDIDPSHNLALSVSRRFGAVIPAPAFRWLYRATNARTLLIPPVIGTTCNRYHLQLAPPMTCTTPVQPVNGAYRRLTSKAEFGQIYLLVVELRLFATFPCVAAR